MKTEEPAESSEPSKQETPAKTETTPSGEPDKATQPATATVPLPSRDRNGRPLRPIGVYLSEIIHVVPRNFRPISISELQNALGLEADGFAQSDQARFVSGFYDIRLDDQLLVSERSELVVQHRAGERVRRRLGEVNLAISDALGGVRPTPVPLLVNRPRLEVDHEGQLTAIIPRSGAPSGGGEGVGVPTPENTERSGDETELSQRSEIRFGWTLQSEPVGDAKKFELLLPRTAQTRLVISTPSDMVLESRQGVLVERPGPPPDADVQTRTGDIRWYVLEAGGLNRLEIYAKRRIEEDSNQPLLVRRDSKQYEVDLAGISWIHRMTLELPYRQDKLQLRLPRGTVTAVGVNSIEGRYQVSRQQDGQSMIELNLPAGLQRRTEGVNGGLQDGPTRGDSAVDLVTLTVEGVSDWELSDGSCELPSIRPVHAQVLWTEPATQSIVTVTGALEVARWELPTGWRQSIQTPTQNNETVLVAEGPPPLDSEPDPIWSRLRLVEREERFIDEVWTRLRVRQTPSHQAQSTSRIRCRLLQNQQSPFEMDLNPDWSVDSVTVIGSGRRMATPVGESKLVVWPTPSEAAQATFEIEVVAQQNLSRNANQLELPSTWIVRPSQHAAAHLISLEPPQLRRWDGNAVMMPGRLESSTLDEEAAAFFQPNPETLMVRSPTGQIPRVTLEPIDVSFGVKLQHLVESEGNDISETIVVRIETTQPIPSLSVLTGQTHQAEFNWSLRRIDQSATVSLPRSSVEKLPDDFLGTYVIQLEGRDLRQYELVGQRFFSADDELTLHLPSVRSARSQAAEVLLDASWEVAEMTKGVQLVPGTGPDQSSELPGKYAQHLRYDPEFRPEVQIRRSNSNAAACLIWDQRFEVIANARSEDVFHLVADISTQKPIHVSFDHELEIVSISRNSVPYKPERTGTGEFWIDPEEQSDRVAVLLRRRHTTNNWVRRCQIPRVRIDGHIVRNRTSYQCGPTTLMLYQRETALESQEAISANANQDSTPSGVGAGAVELYLIPRNIVIGFGWLAAAVLFWAAWSIARWFLLGIHSLFVIVVVSISAAIIWWPYQIAIIGWGAVPVAAAGLLHVVMAYQERVRWLSTRRAGSVRMDDTRSQKNAHDRSADFSVSIPLSSLLLAIALVVAASSVLVAQGPTAESPRRDANGKPTEQPDPIELLVPLDEQHQPVGDKVYLSQSDYDSVRADVDPDRPVDVRFLSADYRVVLTTNRDVAESISAEIQADYRVQLTRPSTRLRFPIAAESLKRIELVSEGETQFLRTTIDERGMVIVTIPSTRQVQLRLTFVPTVTTLDSQLPTAGMPETFSAEAETATGDLNATVSSSTGANTTQANGTETGSDAVPLTMIQLGIPAIHQARLVVEAPADLQVTSLGGPRGRSLFRSELGRYEADLGPIKELAITCRPVPRSGTPRSQKIRRAYRIMAGITTTIVECEIDPEESMSVGDAIQLTILGAAPSSVTSNGWTMTPTENSETIERANGTKSDLAGGVYRFVKRTDTMTPIRMLWRIPSLLNDPTSTSDSKVMPIPEVFASTSRSTPTIFAMQSAESVTVSPLAIDARPADEDDFLAAWRGYAGAAAKVFVTEDAFPSFVLLQDKYPEPALSLHHELHVADSKMELSLKASLVDPRPGVRRLLVSIPEAFHLVHCRVNESLVAPVTQLPALSSGAGGRAAIAIGDRRIDGTVTIELVAESSAGEKTAAGAIHGQWELPRFGISCDGEISETYRMTRERSLEVQFVRSDSGPSAQPPSTSNWKPTKLTQTDLLAGRVPVAHYQSSGEFEAGETTIRVAPRPSGAVFQCDQTTLMRYADGQWFCDTLLELPANKAPDFIDLEIPTRWTTDLAVYGTQIWNTRRSTDSLATVIRIALPAAADANDPAADQAVRVQVTGSLDNRDQGRVSVPSIKVLGTGDRNQIIAVPDQLTTESIAWLPEAVKEIEKRPELFASFMTPVGSPGRYSLYSPIDANWSIELEPLSEATVEPVALSCDARVFLDVDRALVLQRFDILPETRSEISVALPAGATCVGIWSAGREVDLDHHTRADTTTTPETDVAQGLAKIRVPLSYSRLPQSLEVLIEVPVVQHRVVDYLAKLIGVPTQEIWVAYYQTPQIDQKRRLGIAGEVQPEVDAMRLLLQQQQRRAFALAGSVVTAIDRSRDMLAERSDDEIKRWLLPWIARYQSIAGHNGHAFLMSESNPQAAMDATTDSASESSSERPPESRSEAPSNTSPAADADADADARVDSPSQRRWKRYDTQLLQLAGRFLQSRPAMPQPLFAERRFSDYEMVSLAHLESFSQQSVLTQSFTQRRSLQNLLVNAITMLTFGLAVILMWPFRGRLRGWIHEPAIWLFLLGMLGVLLIPLPLAVLLMVVAVTVPLINRWKHRSISPAA